ncbi:uncharacterized protein N7443_001709 [Penicillium atrosanguineum]|uniref:FYVE-type domain-containing protein n=1 Tax=Penicillium atrosanguineum TaxID=1132637 RepID=A0A9W9UDE0_9EURO|nr:uncharacterized protein N7443_001709 [Penicillium atrosanguineum]KAJ5146685.1 hypothetical protein N7526_000037 [Penicillium atrosanguineum]KAJ5314825.1 hypothetical protein N7443_001709 [Penicillium atrosanguineum]KAJ5331998.1 hypothetical protein N7476_001781 [Penicillium atrosanguineum]
MATHVVTAVTATSPSVPNQISVHGQPSPTNSATTTPSNNSPTSPRLTTAALHQLPLQSRQLRPPKGPLYVPAALRPTERPQKSSPITPPRSIHGSLDSLEESAEPISRRSTMESKSSGISKVAEHEWMKNESLGEVTGLPTRDHWKVSSDSAILTSLYIYPWSPEWRHVPYIMSYASSSFYGMACLQLSAPEHHPHEDPWASQLTFSLQADSASPNCDSPTCRSSFGLFLRRHHCRHCGHVFCSSHTPHVVPLDQNARFHPEGVPSRACDLCWSAHQRWEETRTNRLSKIQNSIDKARNGEDSSETSNLDTSQESGRATSRANLPQTAEVAASVPRDWNWSTF